LIDEFRRTGRVDGFEVRWKRKEERPSRAHQRPRRSSEDEPSDVLEAIAEDITERRVLEDQFRQSQKMEAVRPSRGRNRSRFHNLLTVVSGYTEVLLDQLTPAHPLRAKAESIQQASIAPPR